MNNEYRDILFRLLDEADIDPPDGDILDYEEGAKAVLARLVALKRQEQRIITALDDAGIPSGTGNGVVWTLEARLNAWILQALLDRRNIEKLTGGGK